MYGVLRTPNNSETKQQNESKDLPNSGVFLPTQPGLELPMRRFDAVLRRLTRLI